MYDQGVATLTFNRPRRRNAFDDALIAELTAAFYRLSGDPWDWAAILASGGHSFSARVDFEWMRRMVRHSPQVNSADTAGLVAYRGVAIGAPRACWLFQTAKVFTTARVLEIVLYTTGCPRRGWRQARWRCGRSCSVLLGCRPTPRTWSSRAKGGWWTRPSGRRRGSASRYAAPRLRVKGGSPTSSTSAQPTGGRAEASNHVP